MVLMFSTDPALGQRVSNPRPRRLADVDLKAEIEKTLAELEPVSDIDAKVARLIDRLVLDDWAKVNAAIGALVELGRPAVPAIIRRIDDRRVMKGHVISFINTDSGSFEGFRLYATLDVIDALNHVLTEITGQFVGYIDLPMGPHFFELLSDETLKRKNDRQRDVVVAGWRRYLARLMAMPPIPGKSLPW
jgi:hypothetical protein